MGKIRPGTDPKAALVTDILSLSRSPLSCIHINRISGSCFIDWYLILGIQEDAEIKVIRKRYHKLALKVHPDKNNHPKADIAFKLIHEAYLCLSDETKRRCFNTDRRKNICLKCSSRVSHKTKENRNDSKPNRFCQTLRDIRDKFREENKVIERCLKTNSSRFRGNITEEIPVYGSIPNRNRFNKESPVFNPSDYRLWGYPHVRNRVLDSNLSDWGGMFMRSRSTCVHSS
ncbi:PREDICTED: chaperone protein dnaJ 49-like [Camelina sativa]|uniref:Chaperone protein dnaJ 49-like n=1 Tax=Camelina sativa TaxID=90675 RepID=A0ABM0W188_CAMSA|nr:PREDICTED: chaperone protein dnaJ 49-like [Camelina sativa]